MSTATPPAHGRVLPEISHNTQPQARVTKGCSMPCPHLGMACVCQPDPPANEYVVDTNRWHDRQLMANVLNATAVLGLALWLIIPILRTIDG